MTVDKKVAKLLSGLEDAWESSEAQSFTSIPDGPYTAKLVSMELGVSKNERLQVVSTYKVVDGKQKGREVKRFDGIDNDVSMGWFKGYCEVLELDIPDSIKNLPEALETYIENCEDLFNITVKSKDGYQNTYLNGKSDHSDDSNNEPEESTEPSGEDEEEELRKKLEELKKKKQKKKGKK